MDAHAMRPVDATNPTRAEQDAMLLALAGAVQQENSHFVDAGLTAEMARVRAMSDAELARYVSNVEAMNLYAGRDGV